MHFRDRDREEWDFFFSLRVFHLALRDERCWWWKCSFSPNSPILNSPCPLRVLQIPLSMAWQIKSVLIWWEMESCAGVQSFDFPFNFLFIFPWPHLTLGTISRLKLCLPLCPFVCGFAFSTCPVGGAGIAFSWEWVWMPLVELQSPDLQISLFKQERVQHSGLCAEGRWHRGHRV